MSSEKMSEENWIFEWGRVRVTSHRIAKVFVECKVVKRYRA
jgi:hypothetical protein